MINIANLDTIPEHMHEAVIHWVTKAEPHPKDMGHFFFAVLSNNFGEACTTADTMNYPRLREWALFLYNDVPRDCWGSKEKMLAWYDSKHPTREGEVMKPGTLCICSGIFIPGGQNVVVEVVVADGYRVRTPLGALVIVPADRLNPTDDVEFDAHMRGGLRCEHGFWTHRGEGCRPCGCSYEVVHNPPSLGAQCSGVKS